MCLLELRIALTCQDCAISYSIDNRSALLAAQLLKIQFPATLPPSVKESALVFRDDCSGLN
jgi:hypothetical protein